MDGPVNIVTVIKRKPNEDVIRELERMLASAKAGRMDSFIALCSGVDADEDPSVAEFEGGRVSVPDMLFAFECWKLRTMRESTRSNPE